MKEFNEILNEIISFLLNPEITGWLLAIKIIFLITSGIFLSFIIWALIKTEWLKRLFLWDLKEILTYKPYLFKKYTKEWEEIKKRLEIGLESEAKLAIIEADSLLDKALKNLGYPGENLDERLEKLTPEIILNLKEVKEAHKVYSDIIHDPSYKLDLAEAKRIISIFEKTLLDLQVL